MTLVEAAALATFGARDRRLLRAIVQVITNKCVPDDENALPPPHDDEDILVWASRCKTPLVSAEEWRAHAAMIRARGEQDLRHGMAAGMQAIPLDGDRYPPLLSAIPDPPPLVWSKGDATHLLRPSIAIVGSRAATSHGLEMARRLASDLAAAGLIIVSGLARGIDSAAHAAALASGGATVAVLGCGLDRVYPAEHAELARSICSAGALVSEFPPRCPPLPHHFPLRNRIISGLSHAVVVVEAAEKSGALITAGCAAEQGRDVFVVPGPVAAGRNRGGHLLIRDGAKLAESASDILQEVGHPVRPQASREVIDVPLVDGLAFTVDELAERSGELPGVVLARLLELELSGQIQRIGGGRYVRISPPKPLAKADVLP
jgi:DNA processing protein